MQMDAVYLTNEQVPNIAQHKALFFASLCFSSVWEDWEKFKRLQPVDEHEPKVAEIAEKLLELFSETALSVHSLFLASHQYFTQREVDRIVYNDNVHHDKDLLKPKYATVKTEPVHVFVSSSEYPLPSTFSLIKYVPFIIIVVLILSIAGISWTAWHWENKVRIVQADYDLLHAEYVETKTLLTDEKAETTELKKNLLERMNEFNNTKNIINKQLQQIQEKDSRIEKLEDDITKLKTELQDSRKNADESLKKENELLNSENEKLNKKVNQIRQYIEEIHKIVRNELLPEK
jgi:hypothetical protein